MIVEWTLAATPPLLSTNTQEDSTPFWKLLLVIEPLLLAPFSPDQFSSPHQALRARITHFKRGNIIHLIQNTWNHSSPAPTPQPPSNPAPSTTDHSIRRASLAAELDNFHTAFTRLTATLPVATLTEPVIQQIKQKLFPDRIPPPPPIPNPSDQPRRSPRHTLSTPPLHLDNNQTAAVLHKLKRGTAPGPFASTIDSIVVSRSACREILQQRPATLPLLPLYDLLHTNPVVLQ